MRLPIRLGACACALGLGIAGGASLAERQEGGDTLELVQVVFRHGEAPLVWGWGGLAQTQSIL